MDDSVGAGDVRLDDHGRVAVEHGESDVLAALQINFINKLLCLPSPRNVAIYFMKLWKLLCI
jgi:hypothetical protein